MKVPAFLSANTVTIRTGWLYLAILIEIVQLAIIFGL